MSLIGSLEQFDLANILRRIEVFSKTGLLVVKQEALNLWVEFYFRQGQLVCIGPVRTHVTLVDRLMQAKLLSPQSLPQVMQAISSAGANETQIAVALIDEGYLSREMLRAWFSLEASQILQTVFTWQNGDIYFEDDCPTPADRLLVGLSVSMLLDAIPATPSSALRSASASAPSTNEPASSPVKAPDTGRLGQISASQLLENVPAFSSPAPGTLQSSQLVEQSPAFSPPFASKNADAAGFLSASQLIDDNPFKSASSLNAAQFIEDTPPVTFAQATPSGINLFGSELEVSAPAQNFLIPPQPVRNPLPPARIDTSFMTPELVLAPMDLSSLRERNPQVQLTPDEWRVFSLIDGQTSLQALCQTLMAPREMICTLAGELMAIGLVVPLTQSAEAFNGFAQAQMNMAPTQSAQVSPYPMMPNSNGGPQFSVPVETQSQWGNGNNGTTFMVGGGWVLSSNQSVAQPSQTSGAYAPVGGFR